MDSTAYIARLSLLVFILAVNAFFAASEVALLSVRESRLRHLADEGQAGARMALALLADSGKLLSVTQVCVTLASLGLGWAGEDTLFALLIAAFHPILTPATAGILQGACFVLAFAVMTYCHVVIGEVVPKNLAIAKADKMAVIVAPVLTVVSRLLSPFVRVIDGSSTAITRAMGVIASQHRGGGHSAEELKLIISSSGSLPERQEAIIHRVLDLADVNVREIMRPRHDIVSVPAGATLDQVLEAMVSSQHSRLPVWEGAPEHMVGVVFFKDMLLLWQQRRLNIRQGRPAPQFDLRRIMRKPLVVPETKSLPQMLEDFRERHTHMALIVDEFGSVTGLLTVEDVLEQIVGEIEDEHDERAAHGPEEWNRVELDGATGIRDLESIHGVELPANAGFETIAGYILFRLGHIPAVGEAVEFENHRFTVSQMDRNRIASVRVERIGVQADAARKKGIQEEHARL